MSGFKALNVDSESEEEIDDTKEIQTEEAFKLYQNALKLHSQGPLYYPETKAAYKELFQSDLFKYPEAASEFAHDQIDEAAPPTVLPTEVETIPVLPSNAAEASANSIPHLVYLAHKNRGQFALDEARDQLKGSNSELEVRQYYAHACKLGLTDFAEALERDDTDIDLWKKAARVAEILSTPRIARFCLESVLAGDDDDNDQGIDLSGLDEAFAAGELKDLVSILQDDLSQLRNAGVHPKPLLLALLRDSNDPYAFLPKRAASFDRDTDKVRLDTFALGPIKLSSDTIFGLGKEIHHLVLRHQEGDSSVSAHTRIQLDHQNKVHSPAELDRDEFVDAAEELPGSPITTKDATNDIAMTDSSEHQNAVGPDSAAVDSTEQPSHDYESTHVRVDLPSRKRSSAAAGNEEPEGRIKSKRLRARESMHELAAPEEDTHAPLEPPSHQSWNWQVLKSADADMLKTADLFLARLGLQPYGPGDQLWNDSNQTKDDHNDESHLDGSRRTLAKDLCNALKTWTDDHSQALLHGYGTQDFIEKSAGLTLFMQHLKVAQEPETTSPPAEGFDDLSILLESLDQPNTTLYDAVFSWLLSVFTSSKQDGKLIPSPYLRESWAADMKQLVVQLVVRTEQQMLTMLEQLLLPIAELEDLSDTDTNRDNLAQLMEMVLTIFELHIDIHSRITNPSSQVDHITRIEQTDRMERWAAMTDAYMRMYARIVPEAEPADDLYIRFLWATTTYAGRSADVERTFVMTGLQDLQRLLTGLQGRPIVLPNNAAMPLISAAAAEQELFRLSTLDFFMSVFDTENDDSVAVIEKLEPILEADISGDQTLSQQSEEGKLIQFLNSGDASLRLFLWRRLQNAYTTISYTPKVVSCLLRAVETIVREIQRLLSEPTDDLSRQMALLKWLKDVDELVAKTLSKVLGETNALEVIDAEHLRSSLSAICFLVRLVHVHAWYEDQIRFNLAIPPQLKGAASTKLYEKSKDRLREMHVHLWSLQYVLLKEATEQNADLFPDAANDLADYLCTTHHAMGQRHYCRYANKQLVRLVKSELTALPTTNNYLGDMAQVMFDLYQLRFKISEGDFEHGCPSENLDRKTAISLIPMVMSYAKQLPMKDLLKSELRNTIEKVQTASGTVKVGPIVLQNRKLMGTFLKSQLIPEQFYKAFKGQGGLVTNPIEDDDSIKAKYGWYFLLGHITLAKFRSVKRVSPTPTDDLDNAATLLRQDLEHNLEKWETWWRLAQIYEAKIEDDLIWNSSKLNDARPDIAALERHSIHCFLMAMTMAMRSAADDVDTAQKIQDMFREFAIRLYSSSRPPLNMEAFKTDKTLRHLSNFRDQSMSKVPLHAPWTAYHLWKYAAGLLQKRFVNRPKPWITHYYRHKCLWKIFQSPENEAARTPVTATDVIAALVDTVAALPRHQKPSDAILEPHIRFVSLMHKMVRMDALTPHQARDVLQASRFAQGIPLVEDEDGPDWERYLLSILKRLSSADKSNWQHRIINRSAHIIYDSEQNIAGALGAKHEFTQQIFTKTMTYQVWKPELERPGRHYVYTGQYVTFFAHLLDQLQDRANLDQLVRRVRRKHSDFIDHPLIWEHLAVTYVRLLRRIGKIPEGRERALFDSISFEEFSRLSEKLETWALDPDTSSVVLDVMRDGIDLKRLNNSLLKGGIIDDMIGDAYACLYDAYVSQLSEEERAPPKAPAPTSGFINMTTGDVAPDGASTGEHGLGIGGALGLKIQTPSHQFVDTPERQSSLGPAPGQRAVPPNKPGRAKTITRREVQRKAEAAIAKPPPIKTPTLSKRPVIEIAVGGRRASPSRDGDGSHLNSAVTSRRNSIQGSMDNEDDNDDREAGNDADDESELSDVEEEVEDNDNDTIGGHQKRPLFPGLHRLANHDGAGSDADDDDEDDEDNEEDAEQDAEIAQNLDENEQDEDEGDDGDAMAVDHGEGSELEIPDSQQARPQAEEEEEEEEGGDGT